MCLFAQIDQKLFISKLDEQVSKFFVLFSFLVFLLITNIVNNFKDNETISQIVWQMDESPYSYG